MEVPGWKTCSKCFAHYDIPAKACPNCGAQDHVVVNVTYPSAPTEGRREIPSESSSPSEQVPFNTCAYCAQAGRVAGRVPVKMTVLKPVAYSFHDSRQVREIADVWLHTDHVWAYMDTHPEWAVSRF